MSSSRSPVVAALEALGVDFETIEIDPTFADTAAFCEKYGYPLEKSANTIVVVSKRGPKKLAACVVLATHFLDVNKRVRQADASPTGFIRLGGTNEGVDRHGSRRGYADVASRGPPALRR